MVYVKSYPQLPLDNGQIRRFCGLGKASGDELEQLLVQCSREAEGELSYKLCYTELPLCISGDDINLGTFSLTSHDLSKNLEGCFAVVLFAATIGLQIDRYIERYSSVSPTRSLIYSSIGSSQIEVLCDAFCSELETKYKQDGISLRPRFSAGYGDLSVCVQKNIFSMLDCPRKIGLVLNQSMIMSPSKSVTAFVGLYKNDRLGV